MIVAFDYDCTWSAAPEVWRQCTELLLSRGHMVVMITNRPATEEHAICKIKAGIPDEVSIFYAGLGVFKRDYIESTAGIKVDVWIDDRPGTVERARMLGDSDDSDL